MQRKALVVDDEPLVASLTASTLKAAGFDVRTAGNAGEARRQVDSFDPDVAILDISLGTGPTGVDLAHALDATHPGLGLLFLTKVTDLRTMNLSADDLPQGCGYLAKSSVTDAGKLVGAVEAVLRDQSAVYQGTLEGPLATLTRAQLDVLRRVALAYTTAEIARQRNCSASAVEKVLTSVYEALAIDKDGPVNPRAEAMRIYIKHAGVPERA